jgi:hypothetical protein
MEESFLHPMGQGRFRRAGPLEGRHPCAWHAVTAIRKSLEFISARKGYRFEMGDIPADDPETYNMICAADTVGVFQIESRAQQGDAAAHAATDVLRPGH